MPTDLKARIKAGALREKMSLYKPVEQRTPSGAVNQIYVLVDDEVWAEVIPLYGTALFFATQLQPLYNSNVTIRYRDDVMAGWQLVTENELVAYVIQNAPSDINNRHTMLKLQCQAQQVTSGAMGNQYVHYFPEGVV